MLLHIPQKNIKEFIQVYLGFYGFRPPNNTLVKSIEKYNHMEKRQEIYPSMFFMAMPLQGNLDLDGAAESNY